MKYSFEIEVRETDNGYEPSLYGVMLQEGRAATGGRSELFTPGSVQWPSEGIAILPEHRGAVETRAHPVRDRDGTLTIKARATEALKKAVQEGKKYMSIEFHALEERTTAGGVREIISALVPAAALVSNPEYDMTAAEVRDQNFPVSSRRRIWL